MHKKNCHNEGQALLIILLSMATVVTVALSVVSRSVSDVAITSTEEESLRAFSAAEAGVEQALVTNVPFGAGTPQDVTNDTSDPLPPQFTTNISGFPSSTSQYVYPLEVNAGDTATIWFRAHDPVTGNLTCSGQPCFSGNQLWLCWGKRGVSYSSSNDPAVEVSVLYQSGAELRIARGVYDDRSRIPGSSRADSRNCTITTSTGATNYAYRKTVSFGAGGFNISSANLILMRVRMLYNDQGQILGVDGRGSNLPSQGRKIDSTGTAGDTTRKVEVYELYPDTPSIFDSAIFSPGGLTK